MFGISEQWIKEGSGNMKQQQSPRDDELLEKFHKLSPLAQDWLIKRAEEMLKLEMFSSRQIVSNLSSPELLSNALSDRKERGTNQITAFPPEPLPDGEDGFEEDRIVG
jgi:hypothetical protein